MTSESVLEELFEDAADETQEEETEAKAEEEAESEPEEEETGEEAEGEAEEEEPEEEAEPPAAKTEEDAPLVPVAALRSERQKRQELEKELAEMREQMENLDVSDVPEETVSSALFHSRLASSLETAKDLASDYEDMELVFASMAEQNPVLVQQMMAHPSPALFAYKTAKDHTQQERLKAEFETYKKDKDSDEYKEFLEWKKSRAGGKDKRAASMPKLTDEANITTNDNLGYGDDLEDLFADSHF